MNMQLTTPIILPDTTIKLNPASKVMMIGSCFAEHVGIELQKRMTSAQVAVNPFGVLYNPISIAQALSLLISGNSPQADNHIFKGQDGLWHSWLFTTHFSGTSRDECEAKTSEAIAFGHKFLANANLLCITFGTTRCYKLINENADSRFIVANCHKEPQRCFTEEEPSLEQLTNIWQKIIEEIIAFNPTLRICFTVSPYRYRKYGFHESQIQKSKLLLLVDELCKANKCSVHHPEYFPAYEIMMDELRDYRFYADDMLHPSSLAVNIIAERFMDWTFTEDMKQQAEANLKAWKHSQHRQINC